MNPQNNTKWVATKYIASILVVQFFFPIEVDAQQRQKYEKLESDKCVENRKRSEKIRCQNTSNYFSSSETFFVNTEYVTPLTPKKNTYGFSTGFGYRTTKLDFKLGYSHGVTDWGQIEQSLPPEVIEEKKKLISDESTARKDLALALSNFQWNSGDTFTLKKFELAAGVNIYLMDIFDSALIQLHTGLIKGELNDSSVTRRKYDVWGWSITKSLLMNTLYFENLNGYTALKIAIMEASDNKFSRAENQISLHTFTLHYGIEYTL